MGEVGKAKLAELDKRVNAHRSPSFIPAVRTRDLDSFFRCLRPVRPLLSRYGLCLKGTSSFSRSH